MNNKSVTSSFLSYPRQLLSESKQLSYGLKKSIFYFTLPIFLLNIFIFVVIVAGIYKITDNEVIYLEHISIYAHTLYLVVSFILILSFFKWIFQACLSLLTLRRALGLSVDVNLCINKTIDVLLKLFILWLFYLLPYAIWLLLAFGCLWLVLFSFSHQNIFNYIYIIMPVIFVSLFIIFSLMRYFAFSILLFAVPRIMLGEGLSIKLVTKSIRIGIQYLPLIFYRQLSLYSSDVLNPFNFWVNPVVLMMRAILFRDVFGLKVD